MCLEKGSGESAMLILKEIQNWSNANYHQMNKWFLNKVDLHMAK